MNDLSPHTTLSDDDLDSELALTFLSAYHALEQALVRAGFTQPGRRPDTPRPDWEGFTQRIEGEFDPESAAELMGAVCYLLADPQGHALRQERLKASFPGDRSSPTSDLLWLSERIQAVRDRLLFLINFPGKARGNDADVMAALLIIEAWSKIDPQVKSLLDYSSPA